MSKHQGQIVEYVVRRNGYSLSDLANELKVNRRTIYNWFKSETLRTDIIFNVGKVVRHDFSNEFPEIFVTEEFEFKAKYFSPNIETAQENSYKDKYITLLEKYNDLLIAQAFSLQE
ncbi:hypothetical protein [Mucilaginibacter phyllosphaerae]